MAQSAATRRYSRQPIWGATRIIALPTGFACAMHERPMGAIARALHAITLLIAHQMVRDLRECVGKVDVFTVPNLCPLDASPYDFSRAGQLIEQASERTAKADKGFTATKFLVLSALFLPQRRAQELGRIGCGTF